MIGRLNEVYITGKIFLLKTFLYYALCLRSNGLITKLHSFARSSGYVGGDILQADLLRVMKCFTVN